MVGNFVEFLFFTNSAIRNGTQDYRQGGEEGGQGPEGDLKGRQEKEEEEEGILRNLHLQGPQASPSRHWYLGEGNVYHELVCE